MEEKTVSAPKKHSLPLILGFLFYGLAVAALSILGTYWYLQQQKPQSIQPKASEVVCTQDAKLCPDGSYVGRSGPKCEFAPCPAPKKTEQPKTAIEEAVIVFRPAGVFNDPEKDEIRKKFTNPFLDYENEHGFSYVAVIIEKAKNVGNYKYSFDAIGKKGETHDFLFGTKEPLEYWTADCLDKCTFSEGYAKKYPEVVQQSNK